MEKLIKNLLILGYVCDYNINLDKSNIERYHLNDDHIIINLTEKFYSFYKDNRYASIFRETNINVFLDMYKKEIMSKKISKILK